MFTVVRNIDGGYLFWSYNVHPDLGHLIASRSCLTLGNFGFLYQGINLETGRAVYEFPARPADEEQPAPLQTTVDAHDLGMLQQLVNKLSDEVALERWKVCTLREDVDRMEKQLAAQGQTILHLRSEVYRLSREGAFIGKGAV